MDVNELSATTGADPGIESGEVRISDSTHKGTIDTTNPPSPSHYPEEKSSSISMSSPFGQWPKDYRAPPPACYKCRQRKVECIGKSYLCAYYKPKTVSDLGTPASNARAPVHLENDKESRNEAGGERYDPNYAENANEHETEKHEESGEAKRLRVSGVQTIDRQIHEAVVVPSVESTANDQSSHDKESSGDISNPAKEFSYLTQLSPEVFTKSTGQMQQLESSTVALSRIKHSDEESEEVSHLYGGEYISGEEFGFEAKSEDPQQTEKPRQLEMKSMLLADSQVQRKDALHEISDENPYEASIPSRQHVSKDLGLNTHLPLTAPSHKKPDDVAEQVKELKLLKANPYGEGDGEEISNASEAPYGSNHLKEKPGPPKLNLKPYTKDNISWEMRKQQFDIESKKQYDAKFDEPETGLSPTSGQRIRLGDALSDDLTELERRQMAAQRKENYMKQVYQEKMMRERASTENEHLTPAQQLDTLNLVDTIGGHLVTLPTSTPFIALSYVWGNVTTLKAERNNIKQLREHGALFREPYASALPDTIRDAMHVVRASGERYLWVDCLSIVQDAEKEEMDRMLKAMARIYASAEFTIVAAKGDNANYGLRGAGGPSQDRETSALKADLIKDGRNGFPWLSRWASRGWTFQETLFSRRLLVFNTGLSWVCGRHIRLEELDGSDDVITSGTNETIIWPTERPHLGVPMGMMSLIPDKPSLGRWGMIIENYSSRNLTYEQDISRALAGATEVMSATFPGGLHRGLPLFFFDIALLWQPASNLERRRGEPSWSWTGWKGRVDCLSAWYPFFASVYRRSSSYTDWIAMAPLRSLATWRLPSTDDTQTVNNKDFNGFYNYQAIRSIENDTPPTGWTRHSHPQGDYFTDLHFAKTGFQFAFPLPTKDQFEQSPRILSSSILLCTAPIATLSLSSAMISPSQETLAQLRHDTQPTVFSLMHHNASIGSLVVHSSAEFEALAGRSCRLIAISEGELVDFNRAYEHPLLAYYFVSQGWHDEEVFNSLPDLEDRRFYNVLWIEHEDGLAYRKGLGMVSKRHWDALGAKVETVKLG
ncbi:hypothetical protein N0V90_005198 [Kalmusia sp. IMI 367209]|nr:hypothetical protein N0V90_005198 [Kalmusia sp. IMI 367209]